MELAEPTLKGLAILGGADLGDTAFEALVGLSFRNACDGKAAGTAQARASFSDVKGLSGADPVATKTAHTALTTLIYEAAKTDTPTSQITSVLEDAGLMPDRGSTIVSAYEKRKDALRATLGKNRINFPQIVGLDWRLDQHIRSKAMDRVKQPSYLLTLQLALPNGKSENMQVSCNYQELSDLLAKLKSAVSRVEDIVKKKK